MVESLSPKVNIDSNNSKCKDDSINQKEELYKDIGCSIHFDNEEDSRINNNKDVGYIRNFNNRIGNITNYYDKESIKENKSQHEQEKVNENKEDSNMKNKNKSNLRISIPTYDMPTSFHKSLLTEIQQNHEHEISSIENIELTTNKSSIKSSLQSNEISPNQTPSPASPNTAIDLNASPYSMSHNNSIHSIESEVNFMFNKNRKKSQNKITNNNVGLQTVYNFNSYNTNIQDNELKILSGNSLKLFSKNNRFRKYCAKLISWKYMEWIVNLLVFLDWLCIAMNKWEPGTRDSGYDFNITGYIRIGLNSIFLIEIAIKIIVFGLIINSKENISNQIKFKEMNTYNSLNTNNFTKYKSHKSYLRHSVNRIDFIAVLSFWIHLILYSYLPKRFYFFKALGAIRPFRIIFVIPYLNTISYSLKKALPLLYNVLTFLIYFLILFGIIGLILFNDKLDSLCIIKGTGQIAYPKRNCQGHFKYPLNSNISASAKMINPNGTYNKGYICPYPLECKRIGNPEDGFLSFDNIISSTLMVYIVSTMEQWTDIMYRVILADSVWASSFFVLSVIVFNYWLISLFVAVIARMFEKIREDEYLELLYKQKSKSRLKNCILKEEMQLNNHDHNLVTKKDDLSIKSTPSLNIKYKSGEYNTFSTDNSNIYSNRNKIKLIMLTNFKTIKIYTKKYMKLINLIGSILIFSDLILRSYKPRNPEFKSLYIYYLIINGILVFESIFHLIAYSDYEVSNNNEENERHKWGFRGSCIHFILCILNFLILCFLHLINDDKIMLYLSIFSVLRFYKLALLIPRIRSLTLLLSNKLGGILSLLGFILICVLITAPISMELLGGMIPDKNKQEEHIFMRFDSIYHASLSLFQVFSGEDWTHILFNSMRAAKKAHMSEISAIFLTLWSAFSNFILLNLFIAMTMEAFEIAEKLKHREQVSVYVNKLTRTYLRRQKNPISIWNPYRYIKSKPESINVNELPKKLKFSVPKAHAEKLYIFDGEQNNNINDNNGLYIKDSNWFPFSWFKRKNPPHNLNNIKSNHSTHFSSIDPVMEKIINHMNLDEEVEIKQKVTERDYIKAEFLNSHPTYDYSWFIFSKHNFIRQFCISLTDPPLNTKVWFTRNFFFNLFVWISIVGAVIVALINTPLYRRDNGEAAESLLSLRTLDTLLAGCVVIEFIIRTIAHGFIFTPKAYIKYIWFRLDFIVLILFIVDISIPYSNAVHINLALRGLKALRALRLTSISHKVKNTLYGIFVIGLPRIIDVSLLLICFIIPYAIYGSILFSGLLASCNDDSIETKVKCIGEFIDSDLKILMPRVWDNQDNFSFDTFQSSLLILVEILSGEKWVDVMTATMSITSKDNQPKPDNNWWDCLYFLIYYLIGSTIVLSMFVAAIIENYRVYTGISHLTADQRQWIDLIKQLKLIKPKFFPPLTKAISNNYFRLWCYNRSIEKSGLWTKLLSISQLLILIVLITNFSSQTIRVILVRNYIILFCLFICCLQFPIKLIGLGIKAYKYKPWSIVSVLVCYASFITTILSIVYSDITLLNDISNVLALFVTLNLIRKSDRLAQLTNMVIAGLPDILRTLYTWFILYIAYSILFNQVFGMTKVGPNSSYIVNFRDFGSSLLLLFRMTTGESWNDVMHDFTVQEPYCVFDPSDYLNSDCGSPIWAYILFLSFNFLSMYIFANMFIVVVMDNFNYCYEIAASFSLLNRQDIRKFKEVWSEFDSFGTGFIKRQDLVKFIRCLDKPFNFKIYDTKFRVKTLFSEWKERNDIKEILTYNGDTIINNVQLGVPNLNSNDDIFYIDYAKWLDKKLDSLPLPYQRIQKRKKNFNLFYHHALSFEEKRGINFNNILILLCQYKLIDPERCMTIDDLIIFKQKRRQVYQDFCRERALGFCQTLVLRRQFIKRIKINIQQVVDLPSIIIDSSSPSLPQKSLSEPDVSHVNESSTCLLSPNSPSLDRKLSGQAKLISELPSITKRLTNNDSKHENTNTNVSPTTSNSSFLSSYQPFYNLSPISIPSIQLDHSKSQHMISSLYLSNWYNKFSKSTNNSNSSKKDN